MEKIKQISCYIKLFIDVQSKPAMPALIRIRELATNKNIELSVMPEKNGEADYLWVNCEVASNKIKQLIILLDGLSSTIENELTILNIEA